MINNCKFLMYIGSKHDINANSLQQKGKSLDEIIELTGLSRRAVDRNRIKVELTSEE
nr:hypothetical protein [Evansella caseinilytica]